MSVTLIDEAICELDDVKVYVEIKGHNPKQDDLLKSLINRVTYLFQTECNRIFVSDTYTGYYNGNGDNILYLNQYPITSITSIHEDDDWDWEDEDLIDADDYRINQHATGVLIKDDVFERGEENYKVVYVAGYATIPYDLVQACVEEVVRKYTNKKQIDVNSKSIGDGNVAYIQKGLMPVTVKTLAKYKKYNIPTVNG